MCAAEPLLAKLSGVASSMTHDLATASEENPLSRSSPALWSEAIRLACQGRENPAQDPACSRGDQRAHDRSIKCV